MARPSNADLIARVKELESRLDGDEAGGVSHRVKGYLKRIVREPHNAKTLAEQALGLLQ